MIHFLDETQITENDEKFRKLINQTFTGDRLDSLANDYYSDSSLWWIIASANNIHDAAFTVPDGTELRIPSNYLKIVSDFNKQ